MPFGIRPLEKGDIAQSAEIEQDAFPTLFPPTSFRRELQNSMARYLVARSLHGIQERPLVSEPASYPQRGDGGRPLIGRILSNARQLWPRRGSAWEIGQQFLAGFVGIWYMADEAHIVSVGVRRDYRGRGIGELLLLAAVEQASVADAVAFLLARYVAREAVVALKRRHPRFQAFDHALGNGGWRIVALLRLNPAIPYSASNYLFGISGVTFLPYLVASGVFTLPGAFAYTYLGYVGAETIGGETRNIIEWGVLVLGLAVTILTVIYVTILARRALTGIETGPR